MKLALEPLARAADNVLLTQWVLRNLAHEQNLHLSFDPVVKRGHAGSGMHFHMALRKGDKVLSVRQADGEFRPEAQALMAALLEAWCGAHGLWQSQTKFVCPTVPGQGVADCDNLGQFQPEGSGRLPIAARDKRPGGQSRPRRLNSGCRMARRCRTCCWPRRR